MIQLKVNSTFDKPHWEALKVSIAKRISNAKKNGLSRGNNKLLADRVTVNFLNYLLVEDNLEELILLQVSEFISFSKSFFKKFPQLKDKDSTLYKFCENIFVKNAYNTFLCKWTHVKNIGSNVCPYCNRSYITTLSKDKKVKPQIDHFFPTSIYPFFAVSYYNLIPSCTTCNGLELKNNIDPHKLGLKNPYLIEQNDLTFSYIPLKGRYATSPFDHEVLKIEINTNTLQGNLKTFQLEALYNTHKDHIAELIFKSRIKYSEKCREMLKGIEDLNLTDKDFDRLLIGNYTDPNDFHKRPLSKMYYDISKELGLIND